MARGGAGDLDHVIVLQMETYGSDGAGGQPKTWNDIATIRGGLTAGAGREATEAQKLEGTQFYTVKIYRRADVTPGSRLKVLTMSDMLLNVRATNDPGPRERFQYLLCEAGAAQ